MYMELLKEWCDGLLRYQITGMGDARFDGGILCPSCKLIHGRCSDAVYPLLFLADATGEAKYIEAARRLFAWQENMLCDDGSVYNDANSTWNGITVFAAVALCESLTHCGHLLTQAERERWAERMRGMGDWLLENINERTKTNINYMATNAAALSLLGNFFGDEAYLARARQLSAFPMSRFTDDGLLWGEGKPIDGVTKRGCRPIDIGYNVEESVPSLIKHALAQKDDEMLERLREISRKQLDFMMPDGGWDNSFGSRNNKWTYWGSRTSDGCAGGYGLFPEDPLFAEAAYRNLSLMKRCTRDGLLHGGPDYIAAGEPPCVHHTFTHANGLAAALHAGLREPEHHATLPCDAPKDVAKYYPELDTWKIAVGEMRATVTGYDAELAAGHASGGTMTLLWHNSAGVVLASSMVDYRLVEPLNMQLPLKKERHRPLTVRLEKWIDGVRYAQCYDTGAAIRVHSEEGRVVVCVEASLVSLEQERPARETHCSLRYEIREDAVTISGIVRGGDGSEVFVLPVVAPGARVSVEPAYAPPEDIFFLSGGFAAREYRIGADEEGRFSAVIAL